VSDILDRGNVEVLGWAGKVVRKSDSFFLRMYLIIRYVYLYNRYDWSGIHGTVRGGIRSNSGVG
jgi:hypothetical protein